MYVWYILGCHIARLTARERCICRSRRNNSKISGVDTSYLRALRALSTSSKGGKSDKTTDTKSDERDSRSKADENARLSTGTETERMIRSIAEAVKDTGPMDHIEKIDKLDAALSKLVQYFLCNYVGLDTTKHVFGVSDKVRQLQRLARKMEIRL